MNRIETEETTKPDNMDLVRMNRLLNIAARTAHAANKVYCESLGDDSQPAWKEAPEWQRKSAVYGVVEIMKNPDTTPEESHAGWMKQKKSDGWVFGEEKDPEKKTHPCMVPYDELPEFQQVKDKMFGAVVRSILGLL